MDFDRADREILRVLEQDGRIGFAELGDRVGLSKTPCWRRVQALEKAGVIEGYRAVIKPERVGMSLHAFVQVKISLDRHNEFEAAVDRHASVLECYTIAGDGDYLLHVVAAGVEALDALLRTAVSHFPGVQSTSTTVCLKKTKDFSAISALA